MGGEIFIQMINKTRIIKVIFCMINFVLSGVARFCVICIPMRYWSHYLGIYNQNIILSTIISSEQQKKAIYIGRSIQLVSKYTPWNSNCLVQAMVAKFWCSFYRIPYILHIGFIKSAQASNGYQGHAWLKAGKVNVTGGDGLLCYGVVASYLYLT